MDSATNKLLEDINLELKRQIKTVKHLRRTNKWLLIGLMFSLICLVLLYFYHPSYH